MSCKINVNIFCCFRSNRIEPEDRDGPNLMHLAQQAFKDTGSAAKPEQVDTDENVIKLGSRDIQILMEHSGIRDAFDPPSISEQGAVAPQKTNTHEEGRPSMPGSPTNITYTLGKASKANNYMNPSPQGQQEKKAISIDTETEVVEFSSISKQGAVEAQKNSPNNYETVYTEPRIQPPPRPTRKEMMSRSTTPQDLLPKQKQKRIFHSFTQ